ncbi:hypothetical protein [uncultured Bdellovibrio sp.]|uniref:hypothetical protein n=1 Tax=Bdellovibrio sp. HCB-162 TaxID=3394234 RepID=UPI0025E871FC|nr:hypothetical protein [uncultured Bdellovibrio sp.]
MAKKTQKSSDDTELKHFLKDLNTAFAVPVSKKYDSLVLAEYPLDQQLLSLSPIYRESRKLYLSIDGTFAPKVCSTMRSLSAQDLFKDQIDYSPILSETLWFKDHSQEVVDPVAMMTSLSSYNEISLFHEQNHRIVWRLLPPAPKEQRDFCRYLNFAESIVVTLDLVLGDEVGRKLSPVFERLKAIYRPGGEDVWFQKSTKEYRQYIQALLYSTYLVLELVHHEDILKAVDYVLPDQKKINKDAVKRALELSELFTINTNQQWQQRFWKQAQERLALLHKGHSEEAWYLPEDPLDFEEEFVIANRVFDYFI